MGVVVEATLGVGFKVKPREESSLGSPVRQTQLGPLWTSAERQPAWPSSYPETAGPKLTELRLGTNIWVARPFRGPPKMGFLLASLNPQWVSPQKAVGSSLEMTLFHSTHSWWISPILDFSYFEITPYMPYYHPC